MKIIGLFFILSSTILYALMVPLFKKASQLTSPFTLMAVSMFALFTSSLIVSLLFEKDSLGKAINNGNILLLLIGVGLINTVGFWFTIQAYRYMPIWQQTLFGLLTPVLAGIFAYFILGESFSFKLLTGLAIMGFGLFIAIR